VTFVSFLKIMGVVIGAFTILATVYSVIFLRNLERRESFQRRIEAVAGSSKIGENLGKMMIALILFPIFIIVFIQPFKLLTIGLYYALPKTNLSHDVLSAAVWIGFVLAIVCAFLVCRWLWIRMPPKPSA
jgi:uncharacterized membrane protein